MLGLYNQILFGRACSERTDNARMTSEAQASNVIDVLTTF